MELDGDGDLEESATDTHGGSANSDPRILESLHQTRFSCLSRPLSRNVNELKRGTGNTVNDAKDSCMVGCDATERICGKTVVPTD